MNKEKRTGSVNRARLNFILVAVGMLFFVNPVFNFIDILPDAVGCVLIWLGLSRLSYLDGEIDRARKICVWLFCYSAVKLILTPTVAGSYIGSDKLAAVSVALVAEGLLFGTFFKAFFDGLDYFSTRNNCNSAMQRISGTRFLTFVFIFVRLMATTVPELFALIELRFHSEVLDYDEYDRLVDIMDSKPLVVVFLAFLAAVAGGVWYFSLLNTLRSFSKESALIIDEKYVSSTGGFSKLKASHKIKAGYVMLFVFPVFALDLAIDKLRIVPASGMFLFLAIAVLLIGRRFVLRNTLKWAAFAFFAKLAEEIYRYFFVRDDVMVIFETPIITVAVSAVVSIPVAYLCLRCMQVFLEEIKGFASLLGDKTYPTGAVWWLYCILTVLRTACFVLPYLGYWISGITFVTGAFFVLFSERAMLRIVDADKKHTELYGE